MLTKNEITSLSLSPTKKDFVQIWNELLEVASKLSERWDPTSTNESDPGIVILKALTGIADKLNYNIDKNTLEAFMPTAAQEDSMRKLCEMLGYSIKYYQSATTTVKIKYHNSDPSEDEDDQMKNGLYIPKFTVIKNSDQDISYFTINDQDYFISSKKPTSDEIPCMEGQLVKCESINDNNVITINQISEDNRFYLPETQIAENGIFVYNILAAVGGTLVDGTRWKKVDNLNTQARGSFVYKFGFDSYSSRPYIEFPEDYSELFSDGIFVYYTRTNGINGNISAKTLTQLDLPTSSGWDKVSAESFSVENTFAATSGANSETIKQAYNNFKKTIGTFETLVTCRDYMNKIYLMTDEKYSKPLVSNILVTDIRSDLNKAVTICSCDGAGIFYKETTLFEDDIVKKEIKDIPVKVGFETEIELETNKPVYNEQSKAKSSKWCLGSADGMYIPVGKLNTENLEGFAATLNGEVGISEDGYYTIKQQDTIYKTSLLAKQKIKVPVDTVVSDSYEVINEVPSIDHFDLILYPFKSYNQIISNVKDIKEVYDASFNYTNSTFDEIVEQIEASGIKTLAHSLKTPKQGDIVSINNYYKLNATIATSSKVTSDEGVIIKEKIKIALANAFNMRELDFGDEIPFDSIVDVIEGADSRIRVVSLNDPDLYTTFTKIVRFDEENRPVLGEYAVESSSWLSSEAAKATGRLVMPTTDENGNITGTFNTKEAKEIYNKLAVRNVLAGRVSLFNYYDTFKTGFAEASYQKTYYDFDKNTVPSELQNNLNPDNPFMIIATKDEETGEYVTYTGEYVESDDNKYTKTETKYIGNIIKEVNNTDITNIKAKCEVFTEDDGSITDVMLSDGEFVKFRAPNFTTIKTYPAYVNYHLKLQKNTITEASYAEADSLFNILNKRDTDRASGKWGAVFEFFENKFIDAEHETPYKRTFSLTQKISVDDETNQGAGLTIHIDSPDASSETSAEEILAISGCVKFVGVEVSDSAPEKAKNINLQLLTENEVATEYIVNSEVFAKMRENLDYVISTQLSSTEQTTGNAWEISLNFEYIPFESATLGGWNEFISSKLSTSYISSEPTGSETPNYLWRIFGSGYAKGKHVLSNQNNAKLLVFNSNYFGLLPTSRLTGVYLVTFEGVDTQPTVIANNTEYKLKDSEYLYIEYTPSTTTEDGTTQTQAAVTEIYGPGTIIRPSGFESGLVDSDVYRAAGNEPYKTVIFKKDARTTEEKQMQRFGANEQVEIRDFAIVELNRDSFKTNSTSAESAGIYYYKNFNNCDELEFLDIEKDQNNKNIRVNNKYTLKDGEYIFYTDENQAELAYYGSGTQVTLEGNIKLSDKCEIIDIGTVLDSGIQAIPWEHLTFETNDDTIIFKEYQYVTLGPNDEIKQMTVFNNQTNDSGKHVLDEIWRPCENVEYYAAGSETSTVLPAVEIYETNSLTNSGWEACSIFELDVTNSTYQTIHTTKKVKTSLALSGINKAGGGPTDPSVVEAEDIDHPLYFKTNLACQACGNQINIDDVYLNPNKLEGFELKVFAKENTAIVETEPGKVIPPITSGITDITLWSGDSTGVHKDYSEIWSSVDLEDIKVKSFDSKSNYDKALKMSLGVVPGTYAIFCLFINYTSSEAQASAETWIEAIPGTSHNDITLFNVSEDAAANAWRSSGNISMPDKLMLNPGINCIRLNKSSRFFVKTSKDSQGNLLFDEPKLVKYQEIKYDDLNRVKDSTLGLNINQLGYLDTSDAELFTKELVMKRKSDLISDTCAEFEAYSASLSTAASEIYSNLMDLKDRMQLLVDSEADIAKDIDNLSNLNEDVRRDLFIKKQELDDTLEAEKALLKAIENNISGDIDQQLLTLLERLSVSEASQQQLLDELNELKNNAILAADILSDEVILNDFASWKDDTYKNQAIRDIESSVDEKIEKKYFNELADIADSLDIIANSDERNRLLTVLETLKSDKNLEINSDIAHLISSLENSMQNKNNVMSSVALVRDKINIINNTDNGDINSILDEQYYELIEALTSLRNILLANSYNETSFLVSEIKKVFEVNNLALQPYLDKLNTLLTDSKSLEKLADELANYIAYPRAVFETSQTRNLILATCSKIESYYIDENGENGQQIEFIQDIETALKRMNNSESSLIASLIDIRDDQVGNLVTKLTKVIEDRVILRDSFNTVFGKATLEETEARTEEHNSFASWENSSCADIIREAIISVWPNFIKARIMVAHEQLAADIKASNASATDLEEAFIANFTECLYNALGTATYTAFFEVVARKLSIYSQTNARISLIEQVGNKLALSFDTETVNKLNTDRNALVVSILTELSKNDLTVQQKQQKIAILKTELVDIIDLDTQLLDIMADILYPGVNKLEKTVTSEDNFYSKLLGFVKSIKAYPDVDYSNLKQQLTAIEDAGYVAAFECFETACTTVIDETNTFLPDTIINYVKSLVDETTKVATIAKINHDLQSLINQLEFALVEIENTSKEQESEYNPFEMKAAILELKTVYSNKGLENLVSELEELAIRVGNLEANQVVAEAYRDAYSMLKTEKQLLNDIRKVDRNRDFYYNAPIELSLAIEFNESNSNLNTLMNPAMFYDVNNINNNFVISKLDIDYLNTGIQIARSSRLS